MARISKAVREEAILICAIAASDGPCGRSIGAISDALGARPKSMSLAIAARWAASPAGLHDNAWDWYEVSSAEGEALLRTGWSPS